MVCGTTFKCINVRLVESSLEVENVGIRIKL